MKVFLPIVGKDYRLLKNIEVESVIWSENIRSKLKKSPLFIDQPSPEIIRLSIPKGTRLRFKAYQQVTPNRARHLRWLLVEYFTEDPNVGTVSARYKLLENDTFDLDIEPWD